MGTTERSRILCALADEARRIEEDSMHTAKGHFEAARPWRSWHYWIGVPTTAAAAAAGVSIVSEQPIAGAVTAVVAAIGSGLLTFLDPRGTATRHLDAGNRSKALQNDARVFREIECERRRVGTERLTALLKGLNERRNTLMAESPQIPRWAFERAKRGIEAGEADYGVDRQAAP